MVATESHIQLVSDQDLSIREKNPTAEGAKINRKIGHFAAVWAVCESRAKRWS